MTGRHSSAELLHAFGTERLIANVVKNVWLWG